MPDKVFVEETSFLKLTVIRQLKLLNLMKSIIKLIF